MNASVTFPIKLCAKPLSVLTDTIKKLPGSIDDLSIVIRHRHTKTRFSKKYRDFEECCAKFTKT